MNPYPLLFEPLYKRKVWGGRTLARLGKVLPPDARIGESWEIADLPSAVDGGRSVIANGPLAGATLRAAVTDHRAMILGAAPPSDDGGFPLLVKLLDAQENLSVQVHPDDAYVREHPDAHVKSEAWYIVDAAPGAVIFCGLKPGVTRDALAAHLDAGTIVDALQSCPARRGACFYLPSGTCHALGAGILVAEIQTPSDTTFRLYDWGRRDRTLHPREGLACVQIALPERPAGPANPEPFVRGGLVTQPLLAVEHFAIERIDATARETTRVVTNDLPEVWILLAGSARFQTSTETTVDVEAGAAALLPAALSDAEAVLETGTSVLRITLPSPLTGMLARE